MRTNTGTDMSPTTTTDPLLTLHQLFSPSFPVGAFAYSHGLETAVQDRTVASAADLMTWLSGVLEFGAGWTDAIFLAQAANGGDADGLAELALALCPTSERRLETEKQGAAFAHAANALFDVNCPVAPYPVAVGVTARALSLPVHDTVRLYLFSIVSNLAAAGMRLVPLGQTEGQGVIADLTPLCGEIAAKAIAANLDDLGSFAPNLDVGSMRHETLYSRNFRS